MTVSARWLLTSALTVVLSLSGVEAQYSTDPMQNLAVADGSGEQALPLIGSTSDGGVYIAWFDGSTGNYNVRLQLLDAAGIEQFDHNGILISSHPQNSALFGWDMIVDSNDHAVIVFSDERGGGDLDIQAYRVSPTGALSWGADGVTLSDNPDFEPGPTVAEASDGDFVFVWQRDDASGDGDIRMQRLSPDGTVQLVAGGKQVVASVGHDPGFVDVVPAEDGNVILSWLKDLSTFGSDRHVRAQKFSPTGAAVWASYVSVYDAFSVPLGYAPKILEDGAGGAYLWWHRSDFSFFNSFVQHLDAAGVEIFPHNGVAVSTTGGMHHIDPSLAISPAAGEIFVFWNERISNQSQWGIYAQKISAAGARLWGGGGLQLLPVNSVYKSFPRAVGQADGAQVFLTDEPSGSDRLIGIRLDASGNSVWGAAPIVVSSAPGGKSRYPVTISSDGVAKLVWEDERNGAADLYAQNVHPGGSLGTPPVPGFVPGGLQVARSTVLLGGINLSWSPSCSITAQDYAIYEGTIGNFYSHVEKVCTDGHGDLSEDIVPQPADSYYLVVPLTAEDEGSYGIDSAGLERPQAPLLDRCRESQQLGGCD